MAMGLPDSYYAELAEHYQNRRDRLLAMLRRAGFEIEELGEVRPEPTATTSYPFVTLEWARQWPCEEVWKVRRSAGQAET